MLLIDALVPCTCAHIIAPTYRPLIRRTLSSCMAGLMYTNRIYFFRIVCINASWCLWLQSPKGHHFFFSIVNFFYCCYLNIWFVIFCDNFLYICNVTLKYNNKRTIVNGIRFYFSLLPFISVIMQTGRTQNKFSKYTHTRKTRK